MLHIYIYIYIYIYDISRLRVKPSLLFGSETWTKAKEDQCIKLLRPLLGADHLLDDRIKSNYGDTDAESNYGDTDAERGTETERLHVEITRKGWKLHNFLKEEFYNWEFCNVWVFW